MVRTATALTASMIAAGFLTACGSSRTPTASTTFTKVTGVVTDPHGNAVTGANVSITQGGNGTGTSTTDGQGRYAVSGKFIGSIVVNVSISGATVAVRSFALAPLSGDPNTAEANIQLDASVLASSVTVRGTVTDTSSTPVSAALVTVTSGSSAGMTTTTNPQGAFTLQVALPAGLSVAKDGYFAATSNTVAVPVGISSISTVFQLEAPNPAQLSTGAYTLTLSIDGSCTNIPADVSPLSFQGSLAALQGQFGVRNYQFSSGGLGTFPLVFGLLGPKLSVRTLVGTMLDANTLLGVTINGSTVIDTPQPASVTMPFSGVWDYCAAKPNGIVSGFCPGDPSQLITRVSCTAANNLLTLVRQ